MSRKQNTNLKRNTMTQKEFFEKRAQLMAIIEKPCETWQNALNALGIPVEVTNRTAQYGCKIFYASLVYLQLCLSAKQDTPEKAERMARMTIDLVLNRYENGYKTPGFEIDRF